MSNNEYPLKDFSYFIANSGSDMAMLTKVYDLGKKHALADTGDWHNLTEAISAGEPIDFEKLDGQKVRITNGQSSAESKIYRNEYYLIDRPTGWYCMFGDAFRDAWKGSDGWTLWLDGEIPMKKQTANELEPGTEFYGVLKTSEPEGVAPEAMLRTQAHVLHLDDYTISQTSPRHIEVVTVVGMYGQKESE